MIREFQETDLLNMKLQTGQRHAELDIQNIDYAKMLIANGKCYTLLHNDTVIACAGFIHETNHRACLWALFTDNLRHKFITLHRHTLRIIHESPYKRLYMRVHTEFHNGIIWANMLGFECEGIEKQYIDGADFARFALIRA
ncbi:MAG: hypothetical protein EBU90_24415 [Proteobacteria bacterium]|nr:hypothetical protein [Pseudomonadota bacterium]